MTLQEEITRRRTFAVIAHPDAGKTTLTEKLLLFGGAIHVAGAVKSNKIKKGATSDFMEIERQRGISVATSVMGFEYEGAKINILDTPGHEDFAEDTYRTLTAVDSVIIVIDGAKGVEAQTRKLMEVCRMRATPVIVFINKLDRPCKDPFDLLDEVEKAHPDVFNVLLQILDDGRLSDSKGRVINFKNTIIIMTSNVGASQIKSMSSFGFTAGRDDGYDDMKDKINEALKEQFRPEFLNRLDDVIIFRKLTKEEAGKICYKIIDSLRSRLKLKNISLEISSGAMEKLIEEGYSEIYGARPMKRTVQRRIEDRLSDEILAGNVLPGEVVTVDLKDGDFCFRSDRRTA